MFCQEAAEISWHTSAFPRLRRSFPLPKGAIVESEAILTPGSVVPPARRIPSGELWGGNPAKFIRKLTDLEVRRAVLCEGVAVLSGQVAVLSGQGRAPVRGECLPACSQRLLPPPQRDRVIQEAAEHYLTLAHKLQREELPYGEEGRRRMGNRRSDMVVRWVLTRH